MNSQWLYSTIHNSACKVIEEQDLWGQIVCRVWLPSQNAVVRIPQSSLNSLQKDIAPDVEVDRIAYVASAAKIAEILEGSSQAKEGNVLLAPMESNVIPLPHQIHALTKAISSERVRYLLADEVGLGKTIEAGLIMRELKLRGRVRRTLIVAPKGLASQWVSEMRVHFNENFELIFGEDLGVLQRMNAGNHSTYWANAKGLDKLDARRFANPWQVFDQVIVSIDSVKPLDKRRGWSQERLDAYNRIRFEDLITAGWDLVIVDESHRLGGSTDLVARYKLGRGLAEAAPYVLLLSATPHQGKSDAFHRLVNLLDAEAFPDLESVSRERVAPYVIRTEKRQAIDADGKPLFKARRTEMASVAWEDRHHEQQLLYEAVTDYVREGYNQALLQKKHHIGFLMILMQRLVVSSTRAIRTTLERRLALLKGDEEQASSKLAEIEVDESDLKEADELYDMDGQELLNEFLQMHVAAVKNEIMHVETLLSAALRCEQTEPDAKASVLIELLYELQSQENEPDLKVLIFTEFVPTQEMLKEFLEERGFSVVTLNGSMEIIERKKVQDAFRDSHRILISTDAGGEGLNLQFAHVVINYDIPWNPMRLEQRIGRVDRIGQSKTVRAINFVFEESVEFRVREVLEQKLAVILDEFGIDKTGDVLDSAQAGEMFEEVFTAAIIDPKNIASVIEKTAEKLRSEVRQVRETSFLLGMSEMPDLQMAEQLRSHPLPHWLERMTVGYIKSNGGSVNQKKSWCDLNWPDGSIQRKCVFNSREAERLTDATLLNLENSRIRGLALNLPQIAFGQPVPSVCIDGLPANVTGSWGLFEIRISTKAFKTNLVRTPSMRKAYLSVFLSKEDRLFLPTARHIWEQLNTTDARVVSTLNYDSSVQIFSKLQDAAESAGQESFDALRQEHLTAITLEEERGKVSFDARRKAIERVGLPEVRKFREARCDFEEAEWSKELQLAGEIVPEIRALLILNIVNESTA